MSAETTSDPLDIFAETPDNQDQSDSNESQSSANPFDPLGSSQSSMAVEKTTTTGGDPLDLLSQISSWGAQNKGPEEEEQAKAGADTQPEAPVSPTTHKASIMATKENALELSDDLVAEAHKEFEAAEDGLRKFEQQEQQVQKQS